MKRIGLVLLLAACGGAGADVRWGGSVETLPNGAVRITNPAQGVWRDGDAWRLVPGVVIGSVDGPEETVFASVIAIEVDDAGRIYVLDRQINELRIFDRDGTHVRTVGRAGSGPGEYSAANGLEWLADDSLVVVDQRGNRYSVLTRDGDFVRSVLRRLTFYGWNFRGGFDGHTIWEQSSIGNTPEDARAVLLGTLMGDDAAAGTTTEGAPAAGAGTAPVDTVMLPMPTGPLFESFSVRTERAGMVMGVPFAPGPVYHLDGRGGIWHGHGSAFRIVRSTFAGDTLMEILLAAQPAPVSAAELAEWEAGEGVKRFRELGGRLDMDRIPKVKPYFDGILVDPDGYIWAGVPSAPTETVFVVFDAEGRYLGRLQVDGVGRDVYVQPVVRNRRLHFVARDDLDVQRVYVFDIENGRS